MNVCVPVSGRTLTEVMVPPEGTVKNEPVDPRSGIDWGTLLEE
jgi:hypothetical protein